MAQPPLFGVDASGVPPAGDSATNMVSGTIAAVGPSKSFAFWGPLNLLIYAQLKQSLTTAAGAATGTVGSGTNISNGDTISSTLVPPGTTASIVGTTVTFQFPTQCYWGSAQPGSASISLPGATAAQLATLTGATILSSQFAAGTTVVGPGATPGTIQTSAAPTSGPATTAQVPFEFQLAAAGAVLAGTDANALFTGSATPLGSGSWIFQIERSFDGGTTWVAANIGSGALAKFTNLANPLSLVFGEPEKFALYRINTLAFTPVANCTTNYRISQLGQAATSLSVPMLS